MSRQPQTKSVKCYHCRQNFDVSPKAVSTSCPKCNKPVVVQDQVISTLKIVQKMQTCGHVIIKKRGRVIAGVIEGQLGIEVQGVLNGNASSDGHVVIGAKARWKGDCRAPSLEIKPGAKIESGYFQIPNEPQTATNKPTADPS